MDHSFWMMFRMDLGTSNDCNFLAMSVSWVSRYFIPDRGQACVIVVIGYKAAGKQGKVDFFIKESILVYIQLQKELLYGINCKNISKWAVSSGAFA